MVDEATPPGRWLDEHDGRVIIPAAHLWGFGGLHGGLTLALLTRAMQHGADDHGVLRSVTARLYRPVTEAFTTTLSRPRRGRVCADAVPEDPQGSLLASASLVSGSSRSPSLPPIAPPMPLVPGATECERFVVPPEFVPIATFIDVRPVGTNRPYSGCATPELMAWVRLTEDDQAPDRHRLLLLLDALAPSYAALLSRPQPIPTVELTVRITSGLEHAAPSPWILLHAETTWASSDGWLHEHLDAWDPAGTHLASADQLRAVANATSASDPDRAARHTGG